MSGTEANPLIAVACGGTGGHLFPGLAVADVLQRWGCDIALLVSTKEVDQEAVKSAMAMQVLPLPAVALQNGKWASFLRGCWQSYRLCRKSFRERPPRAVLAMGGFTSAPPIVAGKHCSAATFLHESNSIPGRANRWLSPWVDEVFVGFPRAGRRLSSQSIRVTGTPVRPQFKPTAPDACRMAMGLQPDKPVLLVMGGSQGAAGINRLIEGALPELGAQLPDLQFLHLTGPEDSPKMRAAYAQHGRRAVVRPFLTEMDLAIGAATLVVNRAGASSLAELAAMRAPAILIPYPHATDDHQRFNAQALVATGAALLLDQQATKPADLALAIINLLNSPAAREQMRAAIGRWHFPAAADEIAGRIFTRLGLPRPALAPEEESRPMPDEFSPPKRLRSNPPLNLPAPSWKSR
jgi:UDP-N-acetylglucosamine--N-acetylmuramyl-(pentapeptide) pyrophosphoryl-undecaprenol N-acetylglucosamine transferase